MKQDRRLVWGVILVVLGALLLLRQLLPGLHLLWPLVLVALGIWILVEARRGPENLETQALSIPMDGAEHARVRLQHGAGRLQVASGATGGALLSGSFVGGVEERTRREASAADVLLRTPDGGARLLGRPWLWGRRSLDWSVALSREVELALDLSTGANEARLDLADLQVTDLKLSTGASSTTVSLPAHAGYTRVRIEAGAASVSLRVPAGVAARVRVEAGLSGIKIDTSRFMQAGAVYQSPDYDGAHNKVDIAAQLGVGSLDVR